MKFRRYIGFIVFLVGVATAQAQEEKHLEERPEDVYGPTTTLFTTQPNIQYNQGGYKSIADDMSINGLHRFTFVQQYGNKLQNLGNNGTAAKPIFYVLPRQIGATSGFHAYDIYFKEPHQFRYYDTKSPYSKLYVALARFGSFFADVCHSRNVTPNWNIGANFRSMLTDKEWVPAYIPGDRNVVSYGLDIFTHFKTDKERYQLLAYFLIMKHRVRETGGVININNRRKGPYIKEKELLKKDLGNRLEDKAESSDARKHLHLYHQLALDEHFWGYHELGVGKERHLFKATKSAWNNYFLKPTDGQQAQGDDITTMWHIQNELGVKGDWKDLFYCGYYRHKNIELRHQEAKKDDKNLHEHYVGLETRYHLKDSTEYFHAGGEYLFQGLYKARAGYQGTIFDLACERIRYKPSFLAQSYHGYCRKWDKQFTPPTATQISGGFRVEGEQVQLRPHVSFTRVKDHIYFQHPALDNWKEDQRVYMVGEPKHAPKHANILSLGTDLGLAFGSYIHWDSELTAAKVLGPSAKVFSIPTFLVNSRLYYARTTAEGNGTMETGIDVHWKSSYKADGYDPATQQFYRQDEFTVYSYPVMDLFLNFRIKSFSAFLKFSHWNEHLFTPGYFVTPLYPGQKMAFDIGVNWSFFD